MRPRRGRRCCTVVGGDEPETRILPEAVAEDPGHVQSAPLFGASLRRVLAHDHGARVGVEDRGHGRGEPVAGVGEMHVATQRARVPFDVHRDHCGDVVVAGTGIRRERLEPVAIATFRALAQLGAGGRDRAPSRPVVVAPHGVERARQVAALRGDPVRADLRDAAIDVERRRAAASLPCAPRGRGRSSPTPRREPRAGRAPGRRGSTAPTAAHAARPDRMASTRRWSRSVGIAPTQHPRDVLLRQRLDEVVVSRSSPTRVSDDGRRPTGGRPASRAGGPRARRRSHCSARPRRVAGSRCRPR